MVSRKRWGELPQSLNEDVKSAERNRLAQEWLVKNEVKLLPKSKRPKKRKANPKPIKHVGTDSISGRLVRIGFKRYQEYLASEHWKKTKDAWYASKNFHGQVCSAYGCSKTFHLSLHHKTYARLGQEQLSDLVLVCDEHHKQIHKLEKRGMPLPKATEKVIQLPYL